MTTLREQLEAVREEAILVDPSAPDDVRALQTLLAEMVPRMPQAQVAIQALERLISGEEQDPQRALDEAIAGLDASAMSSPVSTPPDHVDPVVFEEFLVD